MADETHNGYANQETWAFNLHWSNHHGLYVYFLGEAALFLATKPDANDFELGEHVVDLFKEEVRTAKPDDFLAGTNSRDFAKAILAMRDEVGSVWRVDRKEIGASVRESLENES